MGLVLPADGSPARLPAGPGLVTRGHSRLAHGKAAELSATRTRTTPQSLCGSQRRDRHTRWAEPQAQGGAGTPAQGRRRCLDLPSQTASASALRAGSSWDSNESVAKTFF